MAIKLEMISKGDTITATSWVGPNRVGIVQEIEPGGKNDRDVIDCLFADGKTHDHETGFWCYLDQVIAHEKARQVA